MMYQDMEIEKIENAPINNIFKKKTLYKACKLDFSQLYNYLDIYAETLEECKQSIDFYLKNGYKKKLSW